MPARTSLRNRRVHRGLGGHGYRRACLLRCSGPLLTQCPQPGSALPIHPKTISNLNDKIYEKRKLGALEVEVKERSLVDRVSFSPSGNRQATTSQQGSGTLNSSAV